MVFDTSLLNPQYYKVHIKGSGAIQGKESLPPQLVDEVAIEKGAFGSLLTMVANFLLFYVHISYIFPIHLYFCDNVNINPTVW